MTVEGEFVKYEDQNQTLIFWSNGIKKSEFLNVLIKYATSEELGIYGF